ncbi:MAG: [LysW]-lysine hydrolase [Natrialbaceae archaeon]|nr:[LysW]-lysine hydrolase [Natrialbaceae archaeon]
MTASVESPLVTTEEARTLLEELVGIPSVSGEESEVAEHLVAFFEAHDREVWIDEVGNVRAPADDAVLLTSHMDTVPGDIPVEVRPAEDDPLASDGEPILWGRGSVDATGSLAAMAAAAVNTGVSFAGVVREETTSTGSRHLVADREAPDALVNGEPSGANGITLGYRGFMWGSYVATSESGHSSRPDPNAIQHAVSWWNAVEDAFPYDEYAPIFEQVTTKPAEMEGGRSEDGLSVEVTLGFQLRVPPSRDVEMIRETVEGELEIGTISWNDPIPPVMQSPRTAVARAFRAAIRGADEEPRLLRKSGTSDMNNFAEAWTCPMVTYGPGDAGLDHTPQERLPLAEFDQSVTILEDVSSTLSEDQ